MLKNILKDTILSYFRIYRVLFLAHYNLLSKIHNRFKIEIINETVLFLNNLKKRVIHVSQNNNIEIDIYTPSSLCFFRAETFSEKEPDTLAWIEEFGKNGSVLYDIGANIGLYSIYHSLLNDGKSYAFEPSFFNLKQLCRNIHINNCENNIVIIPNPLSSSNITHDFKYGSIEEGGALSGFGINYGFDGNQINSLMYNKVIGFSLDYLISTGLIKDTPNMIKIDVDGIEHIILQGAIETISSKKCNSILVEVNSDFKEQEEEVHKILNECGFVCRDKYVYSTFPRTSKFKNTGNEIWLKSFK